MKFSELKQLVFGEYDFAVLDGGPSFVGREFNFGCVHGCGTRAKDEYPTRKYCSNSRGRPGEPKHPRAALRGRHRCAGGSLGQLGGKVVRNVDSVASLVGFSAEVHGLGCT